MLELNLYLTGLRLPGFRSLLLFVNEYHRSRLLASGATALGSVTDKSSSVNCLICVALILIKLTHYLSICSFASQGWANSIAIKFVPSLSPIS